MSKGVVVVTGGSRGIGAEIAVASAEAGHDVVIGYVDPKKQKRADEVVERIKATGRIGLAVRADITDRTEARNFIGSAMNFADDCSTEVAKLVLNAAGGLEGGGNEEVARNINTVAPWVLVSTLLDRAEGAEQYAPKDVVYVTSNPSHFYGHEQNVMPSDVYDLVASTKHEGESLLRRALGDYRFGGFNRLLVATADLVDGTAGATLLRMAHRRASGDRSADLLAERDQQLQGLIGRGITNAFEFGHAVVAMMSDADLPSGHTLYVPRPVLGEHIVQPQELPFGLGAPAMHTFLD